MSEQTDSERSQAMCYVGKAPCGCYLYASVIDPDIKDSTADDISKLIKGGWTIEQKPVQWVRDGGLNFDCPHRKAASDAFDAALKDLGR